MLETNTSKAIVNQNRVKGEDIHCVDLVNVNQSNIICFYQIAVLLTTELINIFFYY